MYCPWCGAENQTGNVYCLKCGKNLQTGTFATKKKKPSRWIGVGVLGAGAILIALVVYLIVRAVLPSGPRSSPRPSATVTPVKVSPCDELIGQWSGDFEVIITKSGSSYFWRDPHGKFPAICTNGQLRISLGQAGGDGVAYYDEESGRMSFVAPALDIYRRSGTFVKTK